MHQGRGASEVGGAALTKSALVLVLVLVLRAPSPLVLVLVLVPQAPTPLVLVLVLVVDSAPPLVLVLVLVLKLVIRQIPRKSLGALPVPFILHGPPHSRPNSHRFGTFSTCLECTPLLHPGRQACLPPVFFSTAYSRLLVRVDLSTLIFP